MRVAIGVLAGLLVALPGVAAAQDGDAMETQRCIWRCLYNSPGASSPQYNACVAQMCQGTTPAQPLAGVGGWTSGLAADGITRFAGMAFPDGSGRGIYFMCTPDGQSYLTLYRMAGMPGLYRLVVDGVGYELWFERSRVELATALGSGAPVMRHVSGGRVLRIEDGTGRWLGEITLSGAGPALQAALSGC